MSDKRIKFLLYFFVVLLIMPMLYLTYFTLFQADKIKESAYNRRNNYNEIEITRGSIYDRNMVELARMNSDTNSPSREYNNDWLYSHIIGYVSKTLGKTGIEKSYDKELSGSFESSTITALYKLFGRKIEGNDVILTVDDALSRHIADIFGANKGAVVVSNATNGDILALFSNPSFNLSTAEENWKELSEGSEARLLNRATQGLYAPGSTYKILTSLVFLEDGLTGEYNDTGDEIIDGYHFKNYAGSSRGNISFEDAFKYSVNTYFAHESQNMRSSSYDFIVKNLSLDKLYKIGLIQSENKTQIDWDKKTEIASSMIGQGKILMSPLSINIMTNIIANKGVLYQPRLVARVQSKAGVLERENPVKEAFTSKIQVDSFNVVREMMRKVITEGTAQSIYTDYPAYGKTGTAEKENDKINALFTGFIELPSGRYSVTVIVEDSYGSGGAVAAPIAGSIMNYLENNY